MASNLFNKVRTYGYSYRADDNAAWARADCAKCGVNVQMAVVGYRLVNIQRSARDAHWLVCASCGDPYMLWDSTTYPPVSPLATPRHLDGDAATAWKEVTTCLVGGAYTASAIMCRKILLHIAVDEGLPAEDARGWAPNFETVVDYLEEESVITPAMKPWATKIRTSGNTAAHKLPATLKSEALTLAEFTRQLLVLHFELPGNLQEMESGD